MPEIGEIRSAKETEHKTTGRFIWVSCLNCGKERWVRYLSVTPEFKICKSCSKKGAANGMWEGGKSGIWEGNKRKIASGYIVIKLSYDDFFYPMTYRGYVREHRFIMAKYLKRCLLSWEVVHHKNGIKDDNRLENLELLPSRGKHNTQIESQLKKQTKQIEELQQRVTLLEAENIMLKASQFV